jgi:hypothetical protein
MATATKSKKRAKAKTKSGGTSAAKRNKLDSKSFAFPKERKEPLNDAKHVRNAVARFDQVEGVTDTERDAAWKRIRSAAKRFGVKVSDRSWRALRKPGRASSKGGKSKGGKSKGAKSKGGKSKKS